MKAAVAPLRADGIPILIGLVNHRAIAKGPFNLGPVMSPVIASVACLWICFITVCSPTWFPCSGPSVLVEGNAHRGGAP